MNIALVLFYLLALIFLVPSFAESDDLKPEVGKKPSPSAVTIDDQKRLIVNGKPFFLIGLYSVWPIEKIAEAKDLGFNTVHTYQGEGSHEKDAALSPEEMYTYLEAADKQGLKVFMGLPRFQVLKGETKRLEDRINLLKECPALIAWYLFDEPYNSKLPFAPIQISSGLIKKLDTQHPTILVECLLFEKQDYHSRHLEYVSMPDILMTDPYPLTLSKFDLSPVTREIDVARKLTKDQKPIWNVIQVHGKGPGGPGYNLKEPNFKELRNMVYQSLASGVKGLTFWAYEAGEFKLYKTPAGLKNVKRITGEVQTLSPILLSDELKIAPLLVTKNSAILTRCYVHEKKIYLMAVNLTRTATQIEVSATNIKLEGKIKLLFDENELDVLDGKFSEVIEPIGVRIYEINNK